MLLGVIQKQTIFSFSNHFNTASHVLQSGPKRIITIQTKPANQNAFHSQNTKLTKMNNQSKLFAATNAVLSARLTKVFTLAKESANLASARSRELASQYEIAKADAEEKQRNANTSASMEIATVALATSTRIGVEATSARAFEVAQSQAMLTAKRAAETAKLRSDLAQAKITASPCPGVPLPRKQTDAV